MSKIAPSILSANFSNLENDIQIAEDAGVDLFHLDVMDGHFVPNITFGPLLVEAVNKITDLTLDVHLMIENPEQYIDDFVEAGADIITVHQETCVHLHRTIQIIKDHKVKAGVALNPATPLISTEAILREIDLLLIMSVNPGFGGQKFIPSSLEKIKAAKKQKDDGTMDFIIEVDGGVNRKTARDISRAGADVLVAGSAIFGEKNIALAIQQIRDALLIAS